MSDTELELEGYLLAMGIGFPQCPKCPERKEGCHKNCKFIKAYKLIRRRKTTSRDKQIEEIAEIILDVDRSYYGMACDEILAKAEATAIYDKDFRKASEVAREIFEEIERETKNHGITYTQRKIAELKKKYVGKDTNVTTKTEEGK